MNRIPFLESERARTTAVFALNPAFERALERLLEIRAKDLFDVNYVGHRNEYVRSPLFPMKGWPHKNINRVTYHLMIDTAALVSVSKIIWFVDEECRDRFGDSEGFRACTANVALGLQLGLPLTCYNRAGNPVAEEFAQSMADEIGGGILDAWRESRKTYTEDIRIDGLRLAPSYCEPALWTLDGAAINLGLLRLTPITIWNVKRLEQWMDLHLPEHDDWQTDESIAFGLELESCAEQLRLELGTRILVGGASE